MTVEPTVIESMKAIWDDIDEQYDQNNTCFDELVFPEPWSKKEIKDVLVSSIPPRN